MADKYANYEELSASEKEGRDFAVSFAVPHNSRTLLLGPHAGGIEPGTSEIILAAAGNDIGYYLFEGLKSQNNGALHITSTSICNRGETGAGVQLELSKGLRRGFFASLSARGRKSSTERLVSFAAALRSGLQMANAI